MAIDLVLRQAGRNASDAKAQLIKIFRITFIIQRHDSAEIPAMVLGASNFAKSEFLIVKKMSAT
jgi:hypothetical protein